MNPQNQNNKTLILILGCSAIFFEAFDVSIVNLSLQSIANGLKSELSTVQWIQTIYLITFGSFLLPGGRMCDYWGCKKVFIIGMTVFGIASISAAICESLFVLLIIRASQGFGAALAMPAAIAILSITFDEGRDRNKAFGIFGSFAAIGFALGLALGGIITTYFTWHWIFSMSSPVILIIVLTAIRFLPDTPLQNEKRFNILSSVLLVLSLILFCYGIHELPIVGFTSIFYISVGTIGMIAMLKYDRKNPNPFFIKSAFSRTSIKGQVSSFILGICFLSFVFISTLILSNIFGLSNKSIGFTLLPFSMLSAFVSKYILPKLFNKFGEKGVVAIAMISLLTGSLMLLLAVTANIFNLLLAALLLVNSFCIAIGYPAMTILALTGVAQENQGTGAGLQSSFYTIGSSIGLSFIGLFLTCKQNNSYFIPILYSCIFIILMSLASLKVLFVKHKID